MCEPIHALVVAPSAHANALVATGTNSGWDSSSTGSVIFKGLRRSTRHFKKDNASVSTLGISSLSKLAITEKDKAFIVSALLEKRLADAHAEAITTNDSDV